jgi:hypothetical protein
LTLRWYHLLVAITVLFIALALVAIALAITALRIARSERAAPTRDPETETRSREPDQDVSELRRGDRPNPPAGPGGRRPDNVTPFYRPDAGDERR